MAKLLRGRVAKLVYARLPRQHSLSNPDIRKNLKNIIIQYGRQGEERPTHLSPPKNIQKSLHWASLRSHVPFTGILFYVNSDINVTVQRPRH